MRLTQILLLLAVSEIFAACEVAPPVRVITPMRGLLPEIQDAVGTQALFNERDGLTYSGVRVYPPKLDGEDSIERPLSLSLKPTGAFLLTVGTEEAAASQGYDGRAAWTLSPRGIVRELGLGSREFLIVDGWLRTCLWLTPGDVRFHITPVKPTGGSPTIELQLKRFDQPIEAIVQVDAASRRPLSYSLERSGRLRTVTFGDWREDEGVWFPYEMTESVDGIELFTDRYARRTIGTPRTLGTPRNLPSDTTFSVDAEAPGAATVPARIDQGGRFYVRASIDTLEEAWMLLDTGFGSHALHVELADSLGIQTGEAAQLQGVSGAGAGTWTEADQLTVGPLTLTTPRLVTVDTSFLSSRAGFEVAGILGAPLFDRAVVTLDEPRARVTIHDPRGFDRRGLTWAPLTRDGSSPCIAGHLIQGGRTGPGLWFRIDTGSDDTVTISEWASLRFNLVGDRTTLRTTRIEGAFGAILGWRRALEQIELGPGSGPNGEAELTLIRPEVTLLRSSEPGPLSDPWIAGNLGTRALSGCRVVLDVSAARIAVQSDGTK